MRCSSLIEKISRAANVNLPKLMITFFGSFEIIMYRGLEMDLYITNICRCEFCEWSLNQNTHTHRISLCIRSFIFKRLGLAFIWIQYCIVSAAVATHTRLRLCLFRILFILYYFCLKFMKKETTAKANISEKDDGTKRIAHVWRS